MTQNFDPASLRQQQFLDVVSKDEAYARFQATFPARPLEAELVPLRAALGRVLAEGIVSPVDVPPFDRAIVDGFAVRAEDTISASDTAPKRLSLNPQGLACGAVPGPGSTVGAASATLIATGAMVPRGADSVVMVEYTEAGQDGIDVLQSARPGQGIAFAGSDIARGEPILLAKTLISSREIGILAACGIAEIPVIRRPLVGVISTGDELIAPGKRLEPAAIYDSNSAILAATIREHGGEAVDFGVIRDDEEALKAAMLAALQRCDVVVLSGGTSKGAGDFSYRIVGSLGPPGILVHGVALKPGKPLCLALLQGKPVVLLPGFPTSAIVTFHTFVVPFLRKMAGFPDESMPTITATTPVRIMSELGRSEFSMVSLAQGPQGSSALASGKGSGAVTSFSQADGFIEIDALIDRVEAGAPVKVNLIAGTQTLPDLLVAGSQCMGLGALAALLVEQGVRPRLLALGSQAGLAMAGRGECDAAPIHLLDKQSGIYNLPFLDPSLVLVSGWRRLQGLAFRRGDGRFAGKEPIAAAKAAARDRACVMVNRNLGAGTRVLIDDILAGAKPVGWSNQPRSHNAVAAAIAQGRADWGITIAPVASAYDLDFMPIADENYDFAVPQARLERAAVKALIAALRDPRLDEALRGQGFRPT